MKKSLRTLLVAAMVGPLLVNCASQSDVADLRYQLRIVNKKLEDMKAHQVDELQKRQAMATGQMDQLENEMLQLKSQIEEAYHLNQRLREQNKELEVAISSVAENEASKREQALLEMQQQQRDKEAKIAELDQKLKLQQDNLKAIQEARIKEAERKAKEAALAAELAKNRSTTAAKSMSSGVQHIQQNQQKVKKEGGSENPPQPAPPVQTSETSNPPESKPEPQASAPQPVPTPTNAAQGELAKAEDLFQQGQFAKAIPLFEAIANQGSGDGNVYARYMMGQCLFQMKDYDKAIMQYQKIISQHAEHRTAPGAMLQQATAFERLADKDTAKVIYKKLLKKHPQSAEAATAQSNLSKL